MIRIVILNDTRNSNRDQFISNLKNKVKVSVTEVGKEYKF